MVASTEGTEVDTDREFRRPDVTYTGTGIEKRYKDWLMHVNGELHIKTSTAARLHIEGRYQDLIHYIEEHS